MKKISIRHAFIAATLFAATAYADSSLQKRLGDEAFYAGDYRNAISSYTSSMQLADKEGNSENWAEAALNLGVAKLHNGDIAGARAVYREFQKRYPLRSAGTLPGDLLAAEKKYDEAEKFFTALLANDPASADATTFSLAMMYMKTGKISEAGRLFASLAGKNSSPYRESAAIEEIYALIRQNRATEAVAKIGEIPEADRSADVELLLYLAYAYSGKTDTLKTVLDDFLLRIPPKPHLRMMELFAKSTDVSVKKGDFRFAAKLLQESLKYTDDQDVKQQIRRRLIEYTLKYSPSQAVSQLKNYTALYPGDRERGKVVINTAAALAESGHKDLTLHLFAYMLDGDYEESDKLQAAASALAIAAAAGDIANAGKYAGHLIKNVKNPSERSKWMLYYAAFLDKQNRKKEAETLLNQAYKEATGIADRDMCSMALMDFYLRAGNINQAKRTAAVLSNSTDPEYAYAGKMELARIFDKASEFSQARTLFLEAAKLEREENSGIAAYCAALMAFKMFDFAPAAKEFFQFSEKYPENSKTPEALFMAHAAYTALDQQKDAGKCEDILRKKYASSEAFATLMLQDAVERGKKGDLAGAVAELERIEKISGGTDVGNEIILQKAVFLDKLGESAEALLILQDLHKSDNFRIASESLFCAGEILFRQGKLPEAEKLFISSSRKYPDSLIACAAKGRAGDSILERKAPISREDITECIKIFSELAAETRYPHIMLQALCKKGIALEHADRKAEAVSSYEQAIYAASDMISQGLYPDPAWCIKSCENALHLLTEDTASDSLSRGLKLISRCKELMLPEEDFCETKRREFIKQKKQRR